VFSSTAALDEPTSISLKAAVDKEPPRRQGENPRGVRPMVNVFLRDVELSVTTRVSVRSDGSAPNGLSYDGAISGDGRWVAFVSEATDLVGGDHNQAPDVFLRDTRTGALQIVSRGESGGSANGRSGRPAISADGAVVVFQSDASDLACGRQCVPAVRDINLVPDVFAFDRVSRSIRRVSVGRSAWMEPSIGPAVDGTGAVVAFLSRHPRDARDDGDDYDLFVRLLAPAPPTPKAGPASPKPKAKAGRT
jgi:hypothetical protein